MHDAILNYINLYKSGSHCTRLYYIFFNRVKTTKNRVEKAMTTFAVKITTYGGYYQLLIK